MPAAERLNRLAERKRALVAQADLHRAMIAVERERLHTRWVTAHAATAPSRGWMDLGLAVGAALLPRRLSGILRFLPAALTVWRMWKR